MFEEYFVNGNAQSGGDHEVHTENCDHLPNSTNRESLGRFTRCEDAMREAKKKYPQINGCYYCCGPCHTS